VYSPAFDVPGSDSAGVLCLHGPSATAGIRLPHGTGEDAHVPLSSLLPALDLPEPTPAHEGEATRLYLFAKS
jgi:hypothetical protein